VYASELALFSATSAAQYPTHNDAISLAMWKASATRARECTQYPTMSSTKKKIVVPPIIVTMRAFLEKTMVCGLGKGIENVRAATQSSACYPSYTVVVFMPDVTLLSKGEEVEGNRKWQALGIGR
jgi:hypothetical protein